MTTTPQNGTAQSVYKTEPIFTKEQIQGMVLPEVMANIKDQYTKSAEIEDRYEGLITNAEDEHSDHECPEVKFASVAEWMFGIRWFAAIANAEQYQCPITGIHE